MTTLPPFTTEPVANGVAVQARGRTGSELFAAASAAYFSTVCRLENVRATNAYDLERQAASLDELFLGWLNDLVWVFSEQEVACAQVNFAQWSPTGYTATLLGEPVDADRHAPRDIIEAASAEGLELEAAEGSWSARVILLT